MYAELRSPNIHEPKNLAEYLNIITHYTNNPILNWAGGTYLMTKGNLYPLSKANIEVVSLGKIAELKHYLRNDRFIEFGAMTSLTDIMEVGRQILPKILLNNISDISSRTLRDSISLGGTIALPHTNSLVATLILLNAYVETCVFKKRIHSSWNPLSYLYDKNEGLDLDPNSLITKVRIDFAINEFEYYKTAGDAFNLPQEAVSVAAVCQQMQNINFRLIFTLPNLGLCSSRDIDQIFSSTNFPTNNYMPLINFTIAALTDKMGKLSPIQEFRIEGILKDMINTFNQKMLTLK